MALASPLPGHLDREFSALHPQQAGRGVDRERSDARGHAATDPASEEFDGFVQGRSGHGQRGVTFEFDVDVVAEAKGAARGLGGLRQGELTDAAFSDLQNRCLDGLLLACSDEEWVVRYAAMVGLEGLLGQGLGTDERAKARAQLQRHGSGRSDDTLVVRLRAQQALERQP